MQHSQKTEGWRILPIRELPLFIHPCYHHCDENSVTPTPLDSALTNSDARNFFRFRFYENCRVSHPSSQKLFSLRALPPVVPPPVPLTHCPPYFLASIFASSTIAALPSGGSNEFQPALRRNPHRLRAPLLGRQYYRALRASLLLRSVCLFGPLPSRSPQLSDGARHEL